MSRATQAAQRPGIRRAAATPPAGRGANLSDRTECIADVSPGPPTTGRRRDGGAAMSLRVVLADDSVIIRAGLTRLLEVDGGLHVVGEAADADTLHRLTALEA